MKYHHEPEKNQFIAIQLFNDFHSFFLPSSQSPVQNSRSLRECDFERMDKSMSLRFHFLMTSVDNLCTWISVGNCVFAGLVLRAGEKGASMNLEAVQLYECSPVSERIFPGVAKLLDPTCHIFKSSYGWEPPNIYHTPRRARRRSAWESASQTKDDNGSPGCPITPRWEGTRVDVQMGPKATQQCWPQRPLPCLLPQPDCPTALMPAGPCYSSCDTDPAGKVCLNCS